MTHSEFTAFWRTACQAHIEVRHGVNGEEHFSRVTLTYDPMIGAAAEIKEYFRQRKDFGGLQVLLINPVARYQDERNDAPRKYINFGIAVLDKPSDDGSDDIEACFDKTERITEELLGYALEKFELIEGFVELNASSGEPLADVDKRYGYKVDVTISLSAYNNLSYKPAQFGE